MPNARKQEFSVNGEICQNYPIIVFYYHAKIQKNQMNGFWENPKNDHFCIIFEQKSCSMWAIFKKWNRQNAPIISMCQLTKNDKFSMCQCWDIAKNLFLRVFLGFNHAQSPKIRIFSKWSNTPKLPNQILLASCKNSEKSNERILRKFKNEFF